MKSRPHQIHWHTRVTSVQYDHAQADQRAHPGLAMDKIPSLQTELQWYIPMQEMTITTMVDMAASWLGEIYGDETHLYWQMWPLIQFWILQYPSYKARWSADGSTMASVLGQRKITTGWVTSFTGYRKRYLRIDSWYPRIGQSQSKEHPQNLKPGRLYSNYIYFKVLTLLQMYDTLSKYRTQMLGKIWDLIPSHYQFSTYQDIRPLIIQLLDNNNFTCRDWEQVR